MAKLQQVLCEEIRKQTRREINDQVKDLKCQIADLQKIVQTYYLRLRQIEKIQQQISPVFSQLVSSAESATKVKTVRITPERIKKWRMKFGLSQGQFAALLGVNILSVNHWESGKADPREEQKNKIIRLQDLSKRDLAKLMEEKHIPLRKRSARKDASRHTVRGIHLSTEIAS